jgi:hypothetical protein
MSGALAETRAKYQASRMHAAVGGMYMRPGCCNLGNKGPWPKRQAACRSAPASATQQKSSAYVTRQLMRQNSCGRW